MRTINYMGKMARRGRYEGRKPSWKKAYVTLKQGEKPVDYGEASKNCRVASCRVVELRTRRELDNSTTRQLTTRNLKIMGIKKLTPTSPARRYQTYLTRDELTPGAEPEKSLLEPKKRISGRNNDGRITVRRRGGGHKRFYRIIDFKRDKDGRARPRHADRVRPEPLGAHRADHLPRRREALHHRAGRVWKSARRS